MRVRSDITDMILRSEGKITRDWLAIADMAIARYSQSLYYLHTDKQIRMDRTAFAEYLELLLAPFIDYTARDMESETRRCLAQVVPVQATASLAQRTLHAVNRRICSTLLEALAAVPLDESSTHSDGGTSDATELIDDLVEYLRWTCWKQCGTCPDEQICYVPIWPMGTHEDHKQPSCRSAEEPRSRWGYWGGEEAGARRPPEESEHTEPFGW